MSINGGHLIGSYLSRRGVQCVFGISGGHIESLLDGLQHYNIQTIDVRHEQAAVMMAHAMAVYTGKPGVCFLTAGPGFTNGITGIANACLDNAPVVVLCGRHPLRDDHKGALQEMNQIDVVKPLVKWCTTCYDTRRIPEYLDMAFRYALCGRPGPVFLELPPDILNVAVEDFEFHPTTDIFKVTPDSENLYKAAEIINSARKPLFIGGSGVGYSNCPLELQAFIEKTGIPFMLLNGGRGILPDNHPLSIWNIGNVGLLMTLSQADVLVAVGIRFNWLFQSGAVIPPGAKVVRIDIEPTEINRNRKADAGLFGDAGTTLKALLPLVEQKNHNEWLTMLTNAGYAFIDSEIKLRQLPSEPIHPIRLVAKAQEVFGTDALYVIDGGDTSYFGLVGFQSKHKAGVISQSAGLLGCLGAGIPFAIAAKLVHPDKQVVVLTGDGSFGFNGFEFDTAVRHNIPFVCIVNNDCAWGMIKHSQELSIGKERVTCAELGIRRYEKVVDGMGGHGEFVDSDSDIIPALTRAKDSGKPACVNVLTDPTATSPATPLFYQSLKFE